MPINVIIPMGGLGSRFSKDGYRFPKPLVNIVGRPMLFWLMDHLSGLSTDDIIWVALSASIDSQFGLVQRLKTEYPHLNIKSVLLTFDTRGAAETLFTVLQSMNPDELQLKTISLDCDTIYFDPILERFKALEADKNASFYFEDSGGKAIFSYVALDEEDPQKIVDVREKVMISTHANTGAYAFRSAEVLRRYCASILDQAVGSVGEYYTTHIIHQMIQDGEYFAGLRVHHSGFTCVGTPAQLTDLLRQLKLIAPLDKQAQETSRNRHDSVGFAEEPPHLDQTSVEVINHPLPRALRKMRFCFDLDNTLVTYPQISKDYSSVLPIEKNIALVRELHAAGHHIIIQTARRMKTHKGNVGAVIADVGHVTLDTLARFDIPYDELLFGKPYADVYVDDLAVHALVDTAKEIGWATGAGDQQEQPSIKGFVAARHFNTLQEMDNIIVKTAATSSIAGEVYFYQHIPDDIRHLFPRLQRVEHNTVVGPAQSPHPTSRGILNAGPQSVSSLFIDKVPGVTFSHLYVNRALTGGRLEKLLTALLAIHHSTGVSTTLTDDISSADVANSTGKVDIYENYAGKMSKRYDDNLELYQSLGQLNSPAVNASGIYEPLYDWFLEYARSERGVHCKVIHGDPVFSNALLTAQGTVVMIDMRGRLGEVLTVQGDAVYDLAKVYQSIDGYDFILHDISMTDTDVQHARELKAVFAEFLRNAYPKVRLSDVLAVTALLYFSLIPLHNKQQHQAKFLARSARLAEQAREQARAEAKTRS